VDTVRRSVAGLSTMLIVRRLIYLTGIEDGVKGGEVRSSTIPVLASLIPRYRRSSTTSSEDDRRRSSHRLSSEAWPYSTGAARRRQMCEHERSDLNIDTATNVCCTKARQFWQAQNTSCAPISSSSHDQQTE
jgi:hypothetical protein